MSLPEQIVKVLREVLPERDFIGLHEPYFCGNEWTYIKECLDTGWVSSAGKYVDKFEEMLAEYTGATRAVAVVNGTAALHIALILAGVKSGDEVLIPALTFVATANVVTYLNATPHLADSDEITLGIDTLKLDKYLSKISELRNDGCYNRQTGRRIKAVVPMHTYGHPVDLDPLTEVCSKYHLQIIEDAAEALGSFYKGKHTGRWGKLSVLSFNGNKIITTGGGGAILTDDPELGKMAKHLTTTARIPHKWDFYHDEVGFNYRLPNINAALGCAQLEMLPKFLEKKRALANRYRKSFSQVEGVKFFVEPAFAKSNYWLNVILLEGRHASCTSDIISMRKEIKVLRDSVLDLTNKMGLMTRPAWVLMNKLSLFSHCPRMDLSVSEDLEARLINIPSSVWL